MPSKIIVKTTPGKGNRVKIAMSFEFDGDDPQAQNIYRGFGLMLKEALTQDEVREFMEKFEAEKAKVMARA
jgi:hypothetical protein